MRDGILTSDPTAGVKRIKVDEAERDYLTAEELQRMINTPYERSTMDKKQQHDIRNGFIFACLTGLRVSDVVTLQWKKINAEKMLLEKYTQKGRKSVFIPLKKEVLELIGWSADKDPEALIFPDLRTKKREIKYSRYLQPWADAAGVHKHISFHVSRHSNATMLLESGAELATVQNLLGHSNIRTTAIYAKVTDPLKRKAIDNLPEFEIK